tara:strand:- start:375 stop:1382 length:1008 start_codon:yes stop_codon:yes gene_type:complete
MKNKYILITGGCGYIGSHTVLELLKKKRRIVVVDNLSNSTQQNIKNIEKFFKTKINFHKVDLRNERKLYTIFKRYKNIDSVIHFAGLKSVNESTKNPIDYYENNISGTITLLNVMKKFKCYKIVFSSSATVYSDSQNPPYSESSLLGYKNPYGFTKLFIEKILENLKNSNDHWKICILRYFNPVGANPQGIIGEEAIKPSNLFPVISSVISSKKKKQSIFGNNYPSKDGTPIRDYVHVEDLARGHINALSHLKKSSFSIFNLGTGKGYTVLEVIQMFEKLIARKIPIRITKRREGDVAASYADCNLAKKVLGWKPRKNLFDMCNDTLRWNKQYSD